MKDKVVELDVRRLRDRPSPRRLAWLDAFGAAETQHQAHDAVLHAATVGSTVEVLRAQLVEICREAAALKWDRMHSTDARERQRLSSRRIRALGAIAAGTIELNKLEGGEPSPRVMAKVLDDLQGVVEGAACELFDSPAAGRFVETLRCRLGPALAEVVSEASGPSRG